MDPPLKVLMVTTNWPAPGGPRTSHFIKRQADFLQAAGVDVDVFHFQAQKNVARYVKAWLAVRRKLRSNRYDLIHAQFGQSGLMALPRSIPYVVTLRGSDILGTVSDRSGKYTFAGRINQRISRMVAAKANGVILVSEHMQGHLPGLNGFKVIPSGIDFDLFRIMPRDEARQQLGLPLEERLALFVGNPQQARKRYPVAKAAVDLLNERLPVRLVVGWGVPHSDIPIYMAACDALVFTSMQEGSPNVVKEALACNLPVVSVAVGDVEQRIGGVEGCELCRDESPEMIAAALERVLLSGKRVEGRKAVEHLSETAITQQVIAVYRSALAAKAGVQ
ncbi:MAG: glycosyltransferase [Pseudomonadota bacterium]|nr:glycosyltransferase [Pseudomonadota bacterium]